MYRKGAKYGMSQGKAHGMVRGTAMAESNPDDPNVPDERVGDTGTVTEAARPKLKKPPLYRVVLLNDDYTPMEFVVQILEQVFSHDRALATRIMLEVHTKGKGVCGVYTFDVADTKVAQVTKAAEQHQHPLLCPMEAD